MTSTPQQYIQEDFAAPTMDSSTVLQRHNSYSRAQLDSTTSAPLDEKMKLEQEPDKVGSSALKAATAKSHTHNLCDRTPKCARRLFEKDDESNSQAGSYENNSFLEKEDESDGAGSFEPSGDK